MDRRAYLVAHVGEEPRFGLAGLLCPARLRLEVDACPLQFFRLDAQGLLDLKTALHLGLQLGIAPQQQGGFTVERLGPLQRARRLLLRPRKGKGHQHDDGYRDCGHQQHEGRGKGSMHRRAGHDRDKAGRGIQHRPCNGDSRRRSGQRLPPALGLEADGRRNPVHKRCGCVQQLTTWHARTRIEDGRIAAWQHEFHVPKAAFEARQIVRDQRCFGDGDEIADHLFVH